MNGFIITQTLYAIRWQLSTPILAIVPIVYKRLLRKESLSKKDIWYAAIIANVIGALIFIWLDKWIFRK